MWPADISRRIWIYVIQKLGIFASVNESQLELSTTKLRLTDLEVDQAKLSIPGLTTRRCAIQQLDLELQVSGLSITARQVKLELEIDQMHKPDLAISMLMDATRKEINEGETKVNSSGMSSKIAEMAISQISANVNDIDIDIWLSETVYITIHIEQGILSSKHRIELENISVHHTEEGYMAQSVYFDTNSAFFSIPDLAFINRVVIEFSLDKMTFSINVDHARISGLSLLKILVSMLNDGVFDQPKEETEHQNEATGEFTLNCLDIYETLEVSRQPLKLENILWNKSGLRITTLEVIDCVHISPFFSMSVDDNLFEAKVEVPVSINIPLDALVWIHGLIDSVKSILNDCEFAENDTPVRFSFSLPDIRISIDKNVVLLILPQKLTNEELQIRECILTAADGQLAVEDLGVLFDGLDVVLKKVRMNLTPLFIESLNEVNRAFNSDMPSETAVDAMPWNGIDLPQMQVSLLSFDISALNWGLKGDFSGNSVDMKTSFRASVEAFFEESHCNFELDANSFNSLRTVESNLIVKQCNVVIPERIPSPKSTDSDKTTSMTGPSILGTVKFEFPILLNLNGESTLVTIDNSDITPTSITIPRIVWHLLDKSGNQTPLLKAKSIKLKQYKTLSIGKCVASVCADSFGWIKQSLSQIAPEPPKPQFKTSIPNDLDTFKDIDPNFYAPENLSRTPEREESAAPLEIRENYMSSSLRPNDQPKTQFEFRLKTFQLQIYDGYDFEDNRKEALESALEHESESDSENEDVRDTQMADSMFIDPTKSPQSKFYQRKNESVELARGESPTILLTIRRLKLQMQKNSMVVSIKDGNVSDLLKSSQVTDLISPLNHDRDLLEFTKTVVGNSAAPEARVSLLISPLHLQIDQDTAEFIQWFISTAEQPAASSPSSIPTPEFIQRLDFSGLELVIDYIPKKIDYKNLTSGTASELLNIFTVTGAKLKLKPAVTYSKLGYDAVLDELIKLWTPDIRATQLGGLIAGVSPVRSALKAGKKVRQLTVSPITHTQMAQGATALFKRVIDEMFKLGRDWFDEVSELPA